MTHRSRQLINSRLFIFLALVGGGYLLYGQSFSFPWLYDDLPIIVENSDIRSLTGFFRDTYPGRPLREVTFLLDYALFGLDPAGYHLQNILWHGLNSVLVFLLARQLSRNSTVPWVAALVFLVHPIAVEVVVQASHRKDSLSLFFSLSSVLLYIKACHRDRGRKFLFLAAFLTAGVGLLAKINAVMVFAVFLTVEIAFIPRGNRFFLKRKVYAPCVLSLTAIIAIGRIAFLLSSDKFLSDIKGAMSKMATLSNVSVESYYYMVLKSHAFMFSKLFFPLHLSPEYTYPVPETWSDPWVISGTLSLFLFAAGLIAFARKLPSVFFSLAWMLLFWVPVSNIFGYFSYFAADRYLYASSAGFAILIGLVLSRVPVMFRIFIVAFTVMSLAVLSFQQARIWSSETAFINHMLEQNPNSREGHIGLANLAMSEERYEEALSLFNEYLEQYRDDPRVYQGISKIHAETGSLEEAIFYAKLAIKADGSDDSLYVNLGVLYQRDGQIEKSIDSLEKALTINPGNSKIYTALGVVYHKAGRLEDAARLYRRAIKELPFNPSAYYNLAMILYEQGEKTDSLAKLQAAHQQDPAEAKYLYYLGMVAAELRKFDLAEDAADKLVPLDPAKGREVINWLSAQKSSSSNNR